jgi:hypothetical protein
MPNFKGFEDWVEIFRGGKQVDSTGREHDGDAMIDKAVGAFSAEKHEPPLVVGHPKDNGPAYGWTEALKSVVQLDGTKILMAKFKGVAPEFEELVRAGRYKKRSAAFYPDGSLRHVGFLGAVPPAVKGLADLQFNEGEPVSFEFSDYRAGVVARLFGRLREYLIEEKGVEAADRIVPDWDVDTLKEEALRDTPEVSLYNEKNTMEADVPGQGQATTFTEADIEAAREKAKEEGRQAAAAEFAEAERQQKNSATKAAIAAFCAKPVSEGGPLPAWLDGGLKEFMEGLDGEATIEFMEKGQPVKRSNVDWFTGFLSELPETVNFKEHAKVDEGVVKDGDYNEIARLATEFRDGEAAAGRSISFTQAVAHVTRNNVTAK